MKKSFSQQMDYLTEANRMYAGLYRKHKGIFFRGENEGGVTGVGFGALGNGTYLTWKESTAKAYANFGKGKVNKYKIKKLPEGVSISTMCATGNLGTDITVFSFQTVRLPNTIEGGALVFNNQEMFEKAKVIRDYGIERANFRDDLNEINPECDIKLEGYGALMGELNSYIGIKQLENLDSLIKIQKTNALIWSEKIQKEKDVKPLRPLGKSIPNGWVYGVLAKNKIEIIKNYRKEGFYATSVHINNNIYSIFGNKTNLSGVNDFMNHFVALPCGWWFNLNK